MVGNLDSHAGFHRLSTGGRLVIGTTPPAKPGLLLGDKSGYNGCYLSTDCGLTFTTQSTSPNILGWAYDGGETGSQGWYDLIIHVDPENADIVHIGGVNLWRWMIAESPGKLPVTGGATVPTKYTPTTTRLAITRLTRDYTTATMVVGVLYR
jgi:hypothetical protein